MSIPGEGSISRQNFNWLQPQSILFPGGSSLQMVHDGLLRYISRDLKDPAGNPIQTHRYRYDAVGNITAIDTQKSKVDYGYDKLYRLTEAIYPQGDSRRNEAYAYDGVGNRLDEKTSKAELDISQWQYNAHNQLVSHEGIGYRYNADGHLIEKGALQADKSLKQSGSIDHWRYRYDSRERLMEVQKNGQLLVKYAYSPLGQRISKTLLLGSKTTYYLYSEEGLVGEYDAQGNLQQEYAYDPTAPWMSQPLFTRSQRSDTQAWNVSYFGTSHLGTPEVAFEKSGEVTWRAKAQAFGETHVTLNTIDNPLRFPGQYFDQETGLYQNYFRDYDPGIGRYMQGDPLGIDDGPNVYLYVSNGPTFFMDSLGLFKMCVPWRTDGDWEPVGRKWTNNDENGTAVPNFYLMQLKCEWVREWYSKFERKVTITNYCLECDECGGCRSYTEEENFDEKKTDRVTEEKENNIGVISVSYGHPSLCTCRSPWSRRVISIKCER